jgi:hypothetical protein
LVEGTSGKMEIRADRKAANGRTVGLSQRGQSANGE